MDRYWAKPEKPREQAMLFSQTLDDALPADHAVRQLDQILSDLDWSPFESRYHGRRGQPPIHPRYVAGAILYGLMTWTRSSRCLEFATKNRIDFMWLLHGMTIDHSTFSQFRKKFKPELKIVFRQINRKAFDLSASALLELAIDGTRIRAYSGRDGARKAAYLEKALQELDALFEKALVDAEQQDAKDDPTSCSPEELQLELKRLQAQREKLTEALITARERDADRKDKVGATATPVQVPVEDPESALLPNKEGGFAPNYTPTAAVDVSTGCIVEADIVEGNSESESVLPAVREAEEAYGRTPEQISSDGNLVCGSDLAELEECGIAVYAPGDSTPADLSPVNRPDPAQPIAEDAWDTLPVKGRKQKQLARSAFLYDEEKDCYWCPQGKALVVQKQRTKKTDRGDVRQTVYRCGACAECPLANRCLSGKSKGRTLTRDEFERHREHMARRMETEEGKAVYRRRAPAVETVFGHIKGGMGIRQFLYRGLENVRAEWLWICTAYNLKKLLRLMATAQKAAA